MTFSRNTISVGIERIAKCAASSCCSSVLTLANTMSACLSEADSNTGAKPLHGPHHGAQKSTKTMSLPVTTSSKLSLVRSIVAIHVSFPRCLALVQLHSRLGASREKTAEHVEKHFRSTVQRVEMHSIERDIHQSREQAFHEQIPAHELAHETTDGAVLAERHERTKIPIDVGLEGFASELPLQVTYQMGGLLMRSLRPSGDARRMSGPWTTHAIAHPENVGIAGGLERLIHDELIDAIGFEAIELAQKLRRLDTRGPDSQLGRDDTSARREYAVR